MSVREYSISVQFISFRAFNFIMKLFLTGLVSTGSIHIRVNPSRVAPSSCGPNEYYSMETKRCDWCSGCPVGHAIKKQCTRYKNTECELCPPGSFSEREGDTCTTCRTCPPGQFVQKECSNSNDRLCTGCPILTFSDKENSATCRPCRTCRTFETTLTRCTVSSDTECGECKPGYFRMHSMDECWKCSPCYPEHAGLTFVMSECQRKVNDSNMTCMPATPPYMTNLETMDSDIAGRTQSENTTHVEKYVLTSFSMTSSVTALLLLTIIILPVVYMKYRNRICHVCRSIDVDNVEECLVENKNLCEKNAQTLSTNCKSNDSDSGLSSEYFNFPTESNLTISSSLTKSRKTKRLRDERLKGRSASTPPSIQPLLRTSNYSDETFSHLKENDKCKGESKTCNSENNNMQQNQYFEVDHKLHPGVMVSEVNECASEADDEEELSVQLNFEDCQRGDPKLISPEVTPDVPVGLDGLLPMSKEGVMCTRKRKKEKRKKKRRQRREDEITDSRRPFVDLPYFSVHTILS
ncbi:hypothetical protein CHS0354_012931 [Potamilus streckersoni]|uniref:TNFR-Cys domain-containing protein n=1 Tax=Potamilus streckersoni TaxID=2493646 RepID=A0AAE0RP02_9BIVA|nr:hypothetical protein CHS0354_012931 [Potamilus streckersoni]